MYFLFKSLLPEGIRKVKISLSYRIEGKGSKKVRKLEAK
jgi:hypothetical protein